MRGCHKGEGSQRGLCCTVKATSIEPGRPCVMQQPSSRARKPPQDTLVSIGFCCCCRLRLPGMRSDDLCWAVTPNSRRQRQAAAGGLRQQTHQQLLAASRSRSRGSVRVFKNGSGFYGKQCVWVLFYVRLRSPMLHRKP